MDPVLWSLLPTALVELVVSKLPFLSIIRMRTVCKSWNCLILSEGFSPPNPNPKISLLHILPVYQGTLMSYDLVKGDWHKLFIDYLPEDIKKVAWLPTLAATGGGLLCYDISSRTENIYIVCNPVRRQWKKLPSMEVHPRLSSGTSVWWRVAGLACDENRGSYKLVVAGFGPDECKVADIWYLKGTQVYDSVTESWTLTFQDREILGGSESFRNAFSKSLFWNNHLYVVTRMDIHYDYEVVIFSMKKGTWIEILASPFMTRVASSSPVHPVLLENQVLFVARELEDLWFWKLNISDMEAMWNSNRRIPHHANLLVRVKCVERDELPPWTPFRFSNWAFAGDKNFTSVLLQCTTMSGHPSSTVFVCDTRNSSWRALPAIKSFKTDNPNPSNFCAFEPSLSASV